MSGKTLIGKLISVYWDLITIQ